MPDSIIARGSRFAKHCCHGHGHSHDELMTPVAALVEAPRRRALTKRLLACSLRSPPVQAGSSHVLAHDWTHDSYEFRFFCLSSAFLFLG
jgi:hypothetical protein